MISGFCSGSARRYHAPPHSRDETGDSIFARAFSPVKYHALLRAFGTSMSQNVSSVGIRPTSRMCTKYPNEASDSVEGRSKELSCRDVPASNQQPGAGRIFQRVNGPESAERWSSVNAVVDSRQDRLYRFARAAFEKHFLGCALVEFSERLPHPA